MAEARIETDEAGNRWKIRGSHRRMLPPEVPESERLAPKPTYAACPVDLKCGDINVPSGKPALVDRWIAPCKCVVTGLSLRLNGIEGVDHVNGLIQTGEHELSAFRVTTGVSQIHDQPIRLKQFEELSIFIETEFPQECIARQARVSFMFDNRGNARD